MTGFWLKQNLILFTIVKTLGFTTQLTINIINISNFSLMLWNVCKVIKKVRYKNVIGAISITLYEKKYKKYRREILI